MKKISTKIKAIIAVIIAVIAMFVGVIAFKPNNTTYTTGYTVNEVFKSAALTQAENAVKEAKEEKADAEETLASATEKEKAAEAQVANAVATINKSTEAKKEAEKELAQATTKEEKAQIQKKINKIEKQIETAKEEKKTAEQKVEQTTKQVEQAKAQVKQAEEKVTETTKKVEEVKEQEAKQPETQYVAPKKTEAKSTTSTRPEVKEETKSESRSLPQSALDAAARSEQANKEAYEKYLQEQKAAGDKAKAEREAQAKAEQEAQDAWNKYIEEQNEAVKNWGAAAPGTVFGNREFTFAYEHAGAPFDVNAKENPIDVKCTGGHCGKTESGYIWFARFVSDYNIFREPGTNTYKSNVLVGQRGDTLSWTQYAPNEIDGHKFDHWEVKEVTEENMIVNVYTAIYK